MIIYVSGYLEDKRIQVALVQKRGKYGHFCAISVALSICCSEPCLSSVRSIRV